MNVIIQVYTDGSEQGIQDLKKFKSVAASSVNVSVRWKIGKDGERVFKWAKDKTEPFALSAFMPVPLELQGDFSIVYNVPETYKTKMIEDWPYGGNKPTCLEFEDLKKKYGYTSIEKSNKTHFKAHCDFGCVSIVKSTEQTIIYSTETHRSTYENAFLAISKMYPLLTIKTSYSYLDWEPGDQEQYLTNHVSEYENGLISYRTEIRTMQERQNPSWAQGNPRRNIWNVIDEHIDENGELNQPNGELPNGRRADSISTTSQNERPERGARFPATPTGHGVLTHGHTLVLSEEQRRAMREMAEAYADLGGVMRNNRF